MSGATAQLNALSLQERQKEHLTSDNVAHDKPSPLSADSAKTCCEIGSHSSTSDDWADPASLRPPSKQSCQPNAVINPLSLEGHSGGSGAKQWRFPAPRRLEVSGSRTSGPTGRLHVEADDDPNDMPPPVPTTLTTIAFEGTHVLEIFGLTARTTSTHLEEALARVDQGHLPAFIRWVAEDRAVAVFSDPRTAASARVDLEGWKLRSFSEASLEARALPAAQLAPPTIRPKTSAAVANRLISSALGMPSVRNKVSEASLAAARKQKADDMQQRQACLAATWDDD